MLIYSKVSFVQPKILIFIIHRQKDKLFFITKHLNLCVCEGNFKWLFSIRKQSLISDIYDLRYTIYIFDSYLAWGMQLMIMKG